MKAAAAGDPLPGRAGKSLPRRQGSQGSRRRRKILLVGELDAVNLSRERFTRGSRPRQRFTANQPWTLQEKFHHA